jgi:hypothetical protein
VWASDLGIPATSSQLAAARISAYIIRARLAERAFRVITFLPPLRGKEISPLIQKEKGKWKMDT